MIKVQVCGWQLQHDSNNTSILTVWWPWLQMWRMTLCMTLVWMWRFDSITLVIDMKNDRMKLFIKMWRICMAIVNKSLKTINVFKKKTYNFWSLIFQRYHCIYNIWDVITKVENPDTYLFILLLLHTSPIINNTTYNILLPLTCFVMLISQRSLGVIHTVNVSVPCD
jgi:hypothetical protein